MSEVPLYQSQRSEWTTPHLERSKGAALALLHFLQWGEPAGHVRAALRAQTRKRLQGYLAHKKAQPP